MKKFLGSKNILISAAVAATSLILVGITFTFNYSKFIETRKTNVHQVGNIIANSFSTEVQKSITLLKDLKGRIEFTNGTYLNNWDYDAQVMQQHSPSFMFIEWIDTSMVIQKISPLIGNENAVGTYIGNLDYRAPQWKQTKIDSLINVTDWLTLVQGPKAFLVDAPVFYDGKFQGTITGGMNYEHAFEQILSEFDEYYVTLRDHNNNEFYTSSDSTGINEYKDYIFADSFKIMDHLKPWSITVQPNANIKSSLEYQRMGMGLFLALIFCLLLSLTTFFMLQAKSAENRLHLLNEDLKTQNDKVEASSQAKTIFLSTMSHEIRTPLSGIMGLIELIKSEKNEDNIREYLELMDSSSKNLLSLVKDVLDINKIESGNYIVDKTEFNIKEEVDKVVRTNKPVFEDKDLYLKLDQSKLEDYTVESDPGKIIQVLSNLIRNAYKFTKKGGVTITTSGKRIGNHLNVKIEVKDTGIGVAKEHQKEIFERFIQIDSGISREYDGSGLGLSISKKIVTLLNGQISLNSELGKGSTFVVELDLPIVNKQPSNNKALAITHAKKKDFVNHSTKKVLIVDDTPLNTFLLEKILSPYQFKIDTADNGEDAVKIASSTSYDLIFMDIHMPKKNGFDASIEIIGKGIETPIITITADVTNEALQTAKKIGIKEFVNKPFTPNTIHSIIDKYVNNN